VKAEVIFSGLREAGILVRYFRNPLIDNHLRISIGTDEEMKAVVEEIDRILGVRLA
jgi:histidinol-phosphate aminotransferase